MVQNDVQFMLVLQSHVNLDFNDVILDVKRKWRTNFVANNVTIQKPTICFQKT